MSEQARVLREARLALGLSLREVAVAVWCSAPTISDIELGKRPASRRMAMALARLYGLDPAAVVALDPRAVRERYAGAYGLLEEAIGRGVDPAAVEAVLRAVVAVDSSS